ncbi:MAG: hypothetical protein HEQ23_06160 [Tepidisphaera sp.]
MNQLVACVPWAVPFRAPCEVLKRAKGADPMLPTADVRKRCGTDMWQTMDIDVRTNEASDEFHKFSSEFAPDAIAVGSIS